LNNFARFVHHNHVKVKTRSWYLFFKFTKLLRQHIGSVAQTIIQSIGDLLTIRAELPKDNKDGDDISSTSSDHNESASFNSQLYLYEAVGCVGSASGVPMETQVIVVRSVIDPLFSDLEAQFPSAKAGDERAILQIHHIISAVGSLAHGVVDATPSSTSLGTPPPSEVSEEFERAAEAILVALEPLNTRIQIRDAARSSFSRLVGVLGNRILPQLPRWIDGLLITSSSKDEIASFLRLLGLVIYGFRAEISNILNSLLTPLLQHVFAGIADPVTGTDDEIQLVELKTHYLAFLQVILNNELGTVLVSAENQTMFEISSIEHFTKDPDDFLTAKIAFQVLSKICATWGGPDIPATSNRPQPSLPGFDRFMMERFSSLAWAIPSHPKYNPNDAQGRQVLKEAAALQKAICAKNGATYLAYLRDVELRGMGMDEGSIEEYLRALAGLDLKEFRNYFVVSGLDTPCEHGMQG